MSEFVADALPLLSTATLLDQLRRGDSAAWERFASRYAPVAYAFSRRKFLSPAESQRIVQSVFSDIRRELESSRFVESESSALEWVLNLADQHLAESAADRTLASGADEGAEAGSHHDATMIVSQSSSSGEPDNAPDDFSQSVPILVQQVLKELKADFPDDTLSIFRRVVVNGESAGEVAEELNLPISSVYRSVHTVLQRLRIELKR